MSARGIIVIGTSLGGLSALEILLSTLSDHLSLPIAIVQHRPALSDETLSLVLQLHSARPVGEPDDKEAIVPNRVYIAPPDYHLLVDRGHFALSIEPRVCHARPSIDVLFDSAAHAYGKRVIGVALTGASKDGAAGLATIKQKGGLAIVQSPDTAESAMLPSSALAATKVDKVLPIPEIAQYLSLLSEDRRFM